SFGRADSIDGLGPASLLEDAFTKPTGEVLGPTMISARNVVAKVAEKTPADLTALPVEHDAILQEIKKRKADQRATMLMDSIVAKLADEGKVVINRKNLQAVVAGFRQK